VAPKSCLYPCFRALLVVSPLTVPYGVAPSPAAPFVPQAILAALVYASVLYPMAGLHQGWGGYSWLCSSFSYVWSPVY
jgi:branched-subunit amino acid transport protein